MKPKLLIPVAVLALMALTVVNVQSADAASKLSGTKITAGASERYYGRHHHHHGDWGWEPPPPPPPVHHWRPYHHHHHSHHDDVHRGLQAVVGGALLLDALVD